MGKLRESPVIYFSNSSPELIKNIQCNWVQKNVLSLSALNPGNSRSQSFYIKKNSDFFGLVSMSWDNASGERVKKEFRFRETNLPSMADSTTYNYVQFYIDQNDLEIVTSDAPDIGGKMQKMEKILSASRDQYLLRNPPVGVSSLIRVQSQ
jgi:hypothetical protein